MLRLTTMGLLAVGAMFTVACAAVPTGETGTSELLLTKDTSASKDPQAGKDGKKPVEKGKDDGSSDKGKDTGKDPGKDTGASKCDGKTDKCGGDDGSGDKVPGKDDSGKDDSGKDDSGKDDSGWELGSCESYGATAKSCISDAALEAHAADACKEIGLELESIALGGECGASSTSMKFTCCK